MAGEQTRYLLLAINVSLFGIILGVSSTGGLPFFVGLVGLGIAVLGMVTPPASPASDGPSAGD